jgi:hypothetical protein
MAELPGFGTLAGPATPAGGPSRFAVALGAVGMGSPVGRFVGISGITAGILYLAKPSMFFDASGKARPWSVLSLGKDVGGVPATIAPFWVVSLFVGFIGATFI